MTNHSQNAASLHPKLTPDQAKKLDRLNALHQKFSKLHAAETDPAKARRYEMVIHSLTDQCLRIYFKIYPL